MIILLLNNATNYNNNILVKIGYNMLATYIHENY